MKRTLFIFEHKKGFFISPENQILIGLTGLFFLLAYLEYTGNFNFGNFIIYLGIIWLMSFIGIAISNFFLQEVKNGEFKGKLELEEHSISVNEESYELNQISKITISANDYEGQWIHGTFNFTRHLSNGLNNQITIKLNNGTEVKCHFFQSKGQRIKNFRDILISYYLE